MPSNTGTPYGHQTGYDEDNYHGAAKYASTEHGHEDPDFFSKITSSVFGNKDKLRHSHIDEDELVRQHKRIYNNEDDGERTSDHIGGAAAVQALKMFTGGAGGSGKGSESSNNLVVGLAMAQAAKMFDQNRGKNAPGSTKEDAVASAAKMAFQMISKSSGNTGSSSSGGASSLLSMASKFM